MNYLYTIFIYFTICSFVGWLIETSYRSYVEKRWVNPGFLYGTFVPIYGFAAVFIGLIDRHCETLPFPVRLALFFIIPTLIEYITAVILEKLLNLKLWDYSDSKFNLHGRVCLKFSIMWMVLVLIDIWVIQPSFMKIIDEIPKYMKPGLSLALFVYFVTDMFLSFGLYKRFAKIKNILENVIESKSEFILENIIKANPVLLKVKDVFKPLSAFPYTTIYVQSEMMALIKKIEKNTVTVIKEKVKKKIAGKKVRKEIPTFETIAEEIISHSEYQRLKTIHHHQHSIYEHCMTVAKLSYKIGRILMKVLPLNITDLTRGALLHDFFLYNWRTEKTASGKLHAFEHPKEAYNNAVNHFDEVTHIERDIILKHMWPLNIVPPRYIETAIVVMVDKLVASKEFIMEFFQYIMKKITDNQGKEGFGNERRETASVGNDRERDDNG